jgi:hypothetical protein
MYGFYFNVSLSVKDDYLGREVSIARKKAEEFKHKGKKLTERWRHVVEFQKKWYNKKYIPMHFFIRD